MAVVVSIAAGRAKAAATHHIYILCLQYFLNFRLCLTADRTGLAPLRLGPPPQTFGGPVPRKLDSW
jgi:hypothetical protein